MLWDSWSESQLLSPPSGTGFPFHYPGDWDVFTLGELMKVALIIIETGMNDRIVDDF